jgi:hypothetical protein
VSNSFSFGKVCVPSVRRTSSLKKTKTTAELAEAAAKAKETNSGDTKAVDIFMTVMRVMVVLGVLSSMSSNSRAMDEARVDDKISTDLERTIENATSSILKEEWRLAVKEEIEKGDQDALNRGLNDLLVLTSGDEESDE